MNQLRLPQVEVRKKKNRKSISLAVKIEIINRIRSGERASAVARSMKLPESTVRTINKDSKRILECSENASSLSSKVLSRKRSKIMNRLESELCQWMVLMSERSVEVSMIMIQEKALEIFQVLQDQEPDNSPDKNERFTASRGWFDRFKKRQNICLLSYGYEKVDIGQSREEEINEIIYGNNSEATASSSDAIDTEIRTDNEILNNDESNESIEAADEFLEFQMVVDDNDEISQHSDDEKVIIFLFNVLFKRELKFHKK